MPDDLLCCSGADDVARLYKCSDLNQIECFIASTPQTRAICNDCRVAGVKYTDSLRGACADVLKVLGRFNQFDEVSGVVVNILRGGLNYGLRNALSDAFDWNHHTTCFISAQRARNNPESEDWHITENAYRKLYFPRIADFFIGDVVATGTSLRYALNELIAKARESGTTLRNIVFFTFGGKPAYDILCAVDEQCRKYFPEYQKTNLVFFEGCFGVPELTSPLTIRLTGTDLTRFDALMAPEFIESQYEDPAYPIERCAIYDAGSRAFHIHEYAHDVRNYWLQVLNLATRGVTYADYLSERFPSLEVSRFDVTDLEQIAHAQIEKMNRLLFETKQK